MWAGTQSSIMGANQQLTNRNSGFDFETILSAFASQLLKVNINDKK